MRDPDENNKYPFYSANGWLKFNYDAALEDWVALTLPAARNALVKKENQHWWRYQRTWFAGVNCLDNDGSGKVEGGVALQGQAVEFLINRFGANVNALDRAQVSVYYPGYPQRSEGESIAATKYRIKRDAAHVDGLLKERESQQRYVREPHDYIFGIALSEFSADASPFVVWSGSHQIIRTAFQEFFAGHEPQNWSDQAITECYTRIRKTVFAECERVEIVLKPGEAILAHRLMLHGTAPWGKGAVAGPDGRMIIFFRPSSLSIQQWLDPSIF